MNFSYNEVYRSDIDSLEKTLTPSLRWRINPRSFLDVAYQKLTTDSIIQKLEREVVTATLRFGF
jgi:hypothetical protein